MARKIEDIKKKQTFKLFSVVVGVSLLVTNPSYAYIDVGTGSLVLQVLAAIGVGAMFYVRSIGRAIKKMIKKDSPNDINSDSIGE